MKVDIRSCEELVELARRIESFEAPESVAHTGTGARREGEQFEGLVYSLWERFRDFLKARGCHTLYCATSDDGPRAVHAGVAYGSRVLYLPLRPIRGRAPNDGELLVRPEAWFRRVFLVEDLVRSFPGVSDAIARYAPPHGPFADDRYPRMYEGLSTSFDGTMLLEDGGVLKHKVLLEYKTGKSSAGRHIDGNAHERLSFQVMQYLEAATRYTRCSLVILANGAFASYRNKYHVSFHMQADRLANFAWFNMRYLCTAPEYLAYLQDMADCLLSPEEVPQE